MDGSPLTLPTNTVLLEGLRDPENRAVWEGFVGRYRPLIVRYLERAGLPAPAAEDVAQAALSSFCEAFAGGRYDRESGRLRSWLFGIVRNHLSVWRRNEGRREAGRVQGTAADRLIAGEEGESALEEAWEHEWREAVLRAAFDEVRREVEPATMRAFEGFVLHGRPAADVAAELGITPNAVFGAKRRVLGRLRELRPLLEDAF